MIESDMLFKKIERIDNYGNLIEKGGNHKIMFADNPLIEHKQRSLSDVYFVESFKIYNTDMSRQ